MVTKAAVRIRASGVVMQGVCELRLPGICRTEDGRPGPITAVWDEQRDQIDVCKPCLDAQLRSGEWVRGEPLREPAGATSGR
ncbi:MAG: hypothetical protein FJX75_23585 [Armatimonadetes bacterium]|nr:hypothetical protein [Armatimonadota bacterium]